MRILFLILLLPAFAQAELVLSEIMANEPGDTAEYEWIEVFNNSDSAVSFEDYFIAVGSYAMITGSFHIEGGEYAVFARHLVARETGPSFESRWGNNSGY